MRRNLLVVSGVLLLLTGCSAQPAPAPTVTVTAPAPAPSESPTEEAVEGAQPLAFGEVVEFPEFTMTVHAVDLDPAPAPAPQPDRAEDKWVSADVEYCGEVDSAVTTTWWRLAAADNRQYESSSVGYDAFPEPAYAWGEVPVQAGQCHRGWITFTVAKDAELESVRYANDKGDSAEWAIAG